MPTREITVDVSTDSSTLVPADEEALRLSADINNTAAELVVQGLPETTRPAREETVTASILGTDVFTGSITAVEPMGDGRTKLRAFDATRRLKKAKLTQSFDDAPIAQIVRAACEAAVVDVRTNLPPERTTAEFTGRRCDEVVEKMANAGRAVVVVPPDGTLTVTRDFISLADRHELESVLDHSSGAATPPYQSVRVRGRSPVSAGAGNRTGGRPASSLISSVPVVATAGDGKPQYQVTDNSITTQQQAKNAAESILQKLQTQQQSGQITIVGDPAIRPYDTVVMPESLAGTEFLVRGVEHTLGARNGFKTTISVGEPIL